MYFLYAPYEPVSGGCLVGGPVIMPRAEVGGQPVRCLLCSPDRDIGREVAAAFGAKVELRTFSELDDGDLYYMPDGRTANVVIESVEQCKEFLSTPPEEHVKFIVVFAEQAP